MVAFFVVVVESVVVADVVGQRLKQYAYAEKNLHNSTEAS